MFLFGHQWSGGESGEWGEGMGICYLHSYNVSGLRLDVEEETTAVSD